jgi:hypothetical protein
MPISFGFNQDILVKAATMHGSVLVPWTVSQWKPSSFLNFSFAPFVGSDGFLSMQVSSSGWSEGECRGKAGWFPSSYVEKRQRIPASKVADAGLTV